MKAIGEVRFCLSQFSKIVPVKTASLRYAVCGCCLCIKNANCYKDAALLHSGNRREVSLMVQILTDIIVAVAAQVIADRLCKWLDSCHKGQ